MLEASFGVVQNILHAEALDNIKNIKAKPQSSTALPPYYPQEFSLLSARTL